jgi:hypothetical protein
MFNLSSNWIAEGAIDFEYKKYLLLAYLRDVDTFFKDEKLYPPFAELIQHHRNLIHLRHQIQTLENKMPKELTELDLDKMKLLYEKLNEDKIVDELQQILQFALPEMETKIKQGIALYDEVENKLSVFSLGLIPIYKDDGYFIISNFATKNLLLYNYHFGVFENALENYRGIKTQFIKSYPLSITNTYEKIKFEIIQSNPSNSTPATFVVEFKEKIPYRETLLPVAKRSLVQYISHL